MDATLDHFIDNSPLFLKYNLIKSMVEEAMFFLRESNQKIGVNFNDRDDVSSRFFDVDLSYYVTNEKAEKIVFACKNSEDIFKSSDISSLKNNFRSDSKTCFIGESELNETQWKSIFFSDDPCISNDCICFFFPSNISSDNSRVISNFLDIPVSKIFNNCFSIFKDILELVMKNKDQTLRASISMLPVKKANNNLISSYKETYNGYWILLDISDTRGTRRKSTDICKNLWKEYISEKSESDQKIEPKSEKNLETIDHDESERKEEIIKRRRKRRRIKCIGNENDVKVNKSFIRRINAIEVIKNIEAYNKIMIEMGIFSKFEKNTSVSFRIIDGRYLREIIKNRDKLIYLDRKRSISVDKFSSMYTKSKNLSQICGVVVDEYLKKFLLPNFSTCLYSLIKNMSYSSSVIIEKSLGLDIIHCDQKITDYYLDKKKYSKIGDKEKINQNVLLDRNINKELVSLLDNNDKCTKNSKKKKREKNSNRFESIKRVIPLIGNESIETNDRILAKINKKFIEKLKPRITSITELYREYMTEFSKSSYRNDKELWMICTPRSKEIDKISYQSLWDSVTTYISNYMFVLYCSISRNPEENLSIVGKMIHKDRIENGIDDIYKLGMLNSASNIFQSDLLNVSESSECVYASFRIKMNLSFRDAYECREEILPVCQFLVENSGCVYNTYSKLMPNVFLYGPAACGKDFLFNTMEDILIKGTTEKVSRSTPKSDSSESHGERDDLISFTPEKDVTLFLKDKRAGGVGDAAAKDFLTSGKIVTYRLVNDPNTGLPKTIRIEHERRQIQYDAANPSIGSSIDRALAQRYIWIPLMPPDEKTSTRVLKRVFQSEITKICDEKIKKKSQSGLLIVNNNSDVSSSINQNTSTNNKMKHELKRMTVTIQRFIQLGLYEINTMIREGVMNEPSSQCARVSLIYVCNRILQMRNSLGCRVPNYRKLDQLFQLARNHCLRRSIIENFLHEKGKFYSKKMTPYLLKQINYFINLQDVSISFGQLDKYMGVFIPGEIELLSSLRFLFYKNLLKIYDIKVVDGCKSNTRRPSSKSVDFSPLDNPEDPLIDLKMHLKKIILEKYEKDMGHQNKKSSKSKRSINYSSSMSGYVRFFGTKSQIISSICSNLSYLNSIIRGTFSDKTASMMADCIYDLSMAEESHTLPIIQYEDHYNLIKYCYWLDRLMMNYKSSENHKNPSSTSFLIRDSIFLNEFDYEIVNKFKMSPQISNHNTNKGNGGINSQSSKNNCFPIPALKLVHTLSNNRNNPSKRSNYTSVNNIVALDVHILYLSRLFDVNKTCWPYTTNILPPFCDTKDGSQYSKLIGSSVINKKLRSIFGNYRSPKNIIGSENTGKVRLWMNCLVPSRFFAPMINESELIKNIIQEIANSNRDQKLGRENRFIMYKIDRYGNGENSSDDCANFIEVSERNRHQIHSPILFLPINGFEDVMVENKIIGQCVKISWDLDYLSKKISKNGYYEAVSKMIKSQKI